MGAVLVTLVRAPERPRPPGERGHRIFRVRAQAISGVDIALPERSLAARRTAEGWTIDGRPGGRLAAVALDDLVETLATLRAVDVFRHEDPSHFGLVPPAGTITVLTARGNHRLALGSYNAAATTLYARRDDDPRLLKVGTLLISSLDRVFYGRDHSSE